MLARLYSLTLFLILEAMAVAFGAWQMLVLSVAYIRLFYLPILILMPSLLLRGHPRSYRMALATGLGLWSVLLMIRLALDLWLPVQL